MNIDFSSFVLQGGKSGVARYIIDLLATLNKKSGDNKFNIYVPEHERKLLNKNSSSMAFNICSKLTANPILSILWHNLILPFKNRNVDLVHIPSYRRIPFIKKSPLIATVHDLATFRINNKYDKLRMFYNRKIVPILIRRCDRIITVSEFSKSEIVHFTGYDPDKIDVIYSGINHKLFRPICKEAALTKLSTELNINFPYICYVSRIEPKAKNHFRLLEAFERYKECHQTDQKLLLVGSNWNGADEFIKRVNKSKYKKDVIMTGYVRDELLPYIYSAASLCVYPSLFEGFGFPVIEALACGAPVICSNTTSLKEISDGRLPCFDPESTDEIYECLTKTLDCENRLQNTRENIKYAKTFNWTITAQKVLESYKKCIS